MELKKTKFKKEDKPQNFLSGGQVGSAATSALAGAGTGAAIGSVVPGIGTAIGAVGGGLIGGIGSLLASSGSSNGPAPAAALPNITNPVTGEQITDAYGNIVASQQQLQNFNNQLQAQGGVQNQSDVYNQFGNIAAGKGPQLAQAILNQNTGQNVSNQAALMASQRGASANPGLVARQAAQQGAGIEQNAVGQAAELQQQQELSALNSQAAIAGQQVGQLQQGLGLYGNQTLTGQGQLLGAQGAYNSALTSGQGSVNAANAPLNTQAQGFNNQLVGGVIQGAGGLLTSGLARGPSATFNGPNYADTSGLGAGASSNNYTMPSFGASSASATPAAQPTYTLAKGGEVENPKLGRVAPQNRFESKTYMPPHMDQVASIYHPHKSFGHPYEQRSFGGGHFDEGGHVDDPMLPMKKGGVIPGKAEYAHNTVKDDTVPAMLSPGEFVIDKETMNSDNPVEGAARKVAHALEKKGDSRVKDLKDFKNAVMRASQSRRKAA